MIMPQTSRNLAWDPTTVLLVFVERIFYQVTYCAGQFVESLSKKRQLWKTVPPIL